MDDLDEAIYRVIHDFAGGARKLAPMVGMNAGTLNNKADPAMETHQLTIRQGIAVQHATGDRRILETEAMLLNCVVIPLGDYTQLSDAELLESYADWHRVMGETAAAIHDAIKERRISREAVRRVRREIFEDAAKAFAFLSRLESLVDE